ncbi:hypothetical protein ACO34A_01690 [Rhizobium sp. ACO-34A]|nr:hypothetical protein ACO34A_01690 [Rhizobium sp. ACO-34A]
MDKMQPTQLFRIGQVLAPGGPLPLSKSAWWQGVRDGRFPQPIKLGPRLTCWRADDIEALIQSLTDARDSAEK